MRSGATPVCEAPSRGAIPTGLQMAVRPRHETQCSIFLRHRGSDGSGSRQDFRFTAGGLYGGWGPKLLTSCATGFAHGVCLLGAACDCYFVFVTCSAIDWKRWSQEAVMASAIVGFDF